MDAGRRRPAPAPVGLGCPHGSRAGRIDGWVPSAVTKTHETAEPVPGFRPGGPADVGDAVAFLGRVVALDAGALVRLRGAGDRVTAYARLPFGVLVSRTVAGSVEPVDATVAAAGLLVALDGPAAGVVGLPPGRDVDWRVALPPATGWRRLDEVPGEVVRSLVRAGAATLRAVPAGAAATAGESLLDHESLTVSGDGRTVALPLRVLTAVVRMGFLGEPDPAARGGDVVVVSTARGWVRLAAAYGSAYQHSAPGLGLSLR